MGLNLSRKNFREWMEEMVEIDKRTIFLKKLGRHLSIEVKINIKNWTVKDEAYPRVGSYTAYNIFRLCLLFITEGDFEQELEPDDDIEIKALQSFRVSLKPASVELPYVKHFLETGDTDTIFIPILFERPFEFEEIFIGSLPAILQNLKALAKTLKFNLNGSFDKEKINNSWIPIATTKNIARIIYQFFKEKPNACVAFD